jgi:hypothetical protein
MGIKSGDIVRVIDTKSIPKYFLGMYGRVRLVLGNKAEIEFVSSVGALGSIAHTAILDDLEFVK